VPCYGIRSTLPANGCSSSIKPLGAETTTPRRRTAVCARPRPGLSDTRASALESAVSTHGPRAAREVSHIVEAQRRQAGLAQGSAQNLSK
jgi:hypothetical protein